MGCYRNLKQGQCGVVLVLALVLLVAISLMAVASLRNASSSESVSGHVRTTELATQAAEIALRHCELSLFKVLGGKSSYVTTFKVADILPESKPASGEDLNKLPASWEDLKKWDGILSKPYLLDLSKLNQPNMTVTYKRHPECMVERLSDMQSGVSSFVITARGFGPEVVTADSQRNPPVGSEIWLQSHIQIGNR
jgi:type IV pilus assembly protein PilX